MSPIIQVMLGMGIGLIGALFLTYTAIQYTQPQQRQGNRNRRNKGEFFAEPGKRCPICLDTMNNPREMSYLNCGHALHDDCFRQVMRHTKTCPECRAEIL